MWYVVATAGTLRYSLALFGGAAVATTVATVVLAKWRLRAAYVLLVLAAAVSLGLLARLVDASFVVSVAEEQGWPLVVLVYAEIALIGVGPALVVAYRRRLNRT